MNNALSILRRVCVLPGSKRTGAILHLLLGVLVLIGPASGSAQAQQPGMQARFALLIANLNYKDSIGELHNPKRDFDLIESALVRIGFPQENIVKAVDLSASGLRSAASSYVERVKAAGAGAISFFYYSGHGASAPQGSPNAGMNYILPSDLDSIDRPDLWDRAVKLDELKETLTKEASEALHIIIFDACRNELKLPARGGTKGFQAISFSQENQYAQVLLAFATSPNKVAYDRVNNSINGPYATALNGEIDKPGIDHLHLFANIRTAVMNMTHTGQIPWTQDGLLSPLVLFMRPSPPSSGPEKCDIEPAPTPLASIEWSEVPDKLWIEFKSHGFTYEQPRVTAQLIEEVDDGDAHHIAEGTKILAGKQGNEIAWYRYQRDAGSARTRYVMADQAEPH
jgi:Caspase domain